MRECSNLIADEMGEGIMAVQMILFNPLQKNDINHKWLERRNRGNNNISDAITQALRL